MKQTNEILPDYVKALFALGKKMKVFFTYYDLVNLKTFILKIQSNIKIKVNYLMLIKIRYKNTPYLTLGRQERLYINDYNSNNELKPFNDFIKQKLHGFTVDYDFL